MQFRLTSTWWKLGFSIYIASVYAFLTVRFRTRVCLPDYCFAPFHSLRSIPNSTWHRNRLDAYAGYPKCTGISAKIKRTKHRMRRASLILTRIFPRLASDWPRPHFSATFSPFPSPFLPSDHPTFAWRSDFYDSARGKIRLFPGNVSKRLRTECATFFVIFSS